MDMVFVWVYGFVMGVLGGPLLGHLLRWMAKPIRCRLGMCGGKIVDTEFGIAFHCATCGKVSGFMSNKTIRETAER